MGISLNSLSHLAKLGSVASALVLPMAFSASGCPVSPEIQRLSKLDMKPVPADVAKVSLNHITDRLYSLTAEGSRLESVKDAQLSLEVENEQDPGADTLRVNALWRGLHAATDASTYYPSASSWQSQMYFQMPPSIKKVCFYGNMRQPIVQNVDPAQELKWESSIEPCHYSMEAQRQKGQTFRVRIKDSWLSGDPSMECCQIKSSALSDVMFLQPWKDRESSFANYVELPPTVKKIGLIGHGGWPVAWRLDGTLDPIPWDMHLSAIKKFGRTFRVSLKATTYGTRLRSDTFAFFRSK